MVIIDVFWRRTSNVDATMITTLLFQSSSHGLVFFLPFNTESPRKPNRFSLQLTYFLPTLKYVHGLVAARACLNKLQPCLRGRQQQFAILPDTPTH